MLLAGVYLLSRLTAARNVWLVCESGGPKRYWVPLKRMGRKVDIQMLSLQNDYPQNDPTLLMYTALGRRLRPGRVPTEQGALLIDGALAVAIGRQALRRQPMLQAPLAVHDHVRDRVAFVVAPIGMPVRQLLGQIGASAEGVALLRGNVLRDNEVSPDAVVSGGELVLHVLPRPAALMPAPCVRCGWCVEGCPTRVQPAGLLEAAQRENLLLADHYGLDACIECGVCTYVCPSNLPILEGIRKLKAAAKKL
jgi:electron transport complex protein RnfC